MCVRVCVCVNRESTVKAAAVKAAAVKAAGACTASAARRKREREREREQRHACCCRCCRCCCEPKESPQLVQCLHRFSNKARARAMASAKTGKTREARAKTENVGAQRVFRRSIWTVLTQLFGSQGLFLTEINRGLRALSMSLHARCGTSKQKITPLRRPSARGL